MKKIVFTLVLLPDDEKYNELAERFYCVPKNEEEYKLTRNTVIKDIFNYAKNNNKKLNIIKNMKEFIYVLNNKKKDKCITVFTTEYKELIHIKEDKCYCNLIIINDDNVTYYLLQKDMNIKVILLNDVTKKCMICDTTYCKKKDSKHVTCPCCSYTFCYECLIKILDTDGVVNCPQCRSTLHGYHDIE